MDTIRKSYKSGAKEIVGRTGPAVEAVRAAADNIQNATAWTSDVGRLWGAAGGPKAVKMVTEGMAHTKSVPAHFRQGLTNEGPAETLGGRIGRRIGRAWKSARDSFNSAPAGMPVRMSAREELDVIKFMFTWSDDPLKVEATGGWDVAKARLKDDEGGFMDENIARNKKRGALNAIKRLGGRPKLNPFLYHDKAGYSAAFKKANPHWETNSTGMFSAREGLEQIINFGIFSTGTAKKVFRGLQGSAERSPLVRPGVFGMGPSFIPKNSPKESLGMISSIYEHPGVRPGTTVVPRLSAEAQADAAASLPKGAQGIFKDPVAIAAHERGHAYDPKIEARQATQYKHAEQMQKKMGDKAPFEDPETKPIAQKLMAGMLEHESVANRRVMDQVRQHGTPQEADAWKKYANNQMKVGYRAPMFEGGTAGKSLTEKKDFLRENSFLRRSATALEARSGVLFFNTSNFAGRSGRLSTREELDSIIQMSMEEPTERTKRASKENWAAKAKLGQKSISREAGSKAGKKMLDETAKFIKKLSARDQLNTIMFGSASPEKKAKLDAEWRKKMKPIIEEARRTGKFKSAEDRAAYAAYSARDQLNLITLGSHADTYQYGHVSFLDPKTGRRSGRPMTKEESLAAHARRAAEKASGIERAVWKNPNRTELSAILFGVDANGKLHNSKGEFGGDNDAVAHPDAMRATYQRAAGLGATAGAAGVAGGMGMKALIEKLKGLKRK